MNKTVKVNQTATSILSVILVSLFPGLFLYFNNLGKVLAREAAGILALIVILALVLMAGIYWLVKDIAKAGLLTSIFMAMFLYFALIETAVIRVFPMLYYWHVVLICLFLFGHILFFVHKSMAPAFAGQLNQGLLVIFAGLILYNGLGKVPQFIKTVTQAGPAESQNQPAAGAPGDGAVPSSLPNVYYFIFDEYAGYDSILRYCGYDNTDFYTSLEGLGFVTSKHSVNGSGDSYIEVPNLLQLQEINSVDMLDNDKKENLKNPYLFLLMKQYGYSINLLDSTNYQFLDYTYADHRFISQVASTYRTFNSYVIKNTAVYPFYGTRDQDYEMNVILNMFEYAAASSSLASSNLLTVGYFSFPHIPYIFDEHGNKTNNSDRTNLSDPAPYLGQFKYASQKILEMATGILANDPGAIIILQSDHGYRLPSHLYYWYGNTDYDLDAEARYERNILNAVYYPGEDVDIESLSGLNTLKVVLNEVLDTNLEVEK